MFDNIQSAAITAAGTSMLVAGSVIWSMTRPPPPVLMKRANYESQSILIDEKNLTRKSQFEESFDIRRGDFRDIHTLYDVFQCGLSHGRDEPCLGYKESGSKDYRWITFAEVERNSIDTGAGIIHRLKQAPVQDTRIGIFMKNCVEFVYIEQSCSRYSMVPVPLYDTLGEESCIFIINKVRCQSIFVDNEKKINLLLEKRSQIPSLKYIICIHSLEKETVERGKQCDIDVLHFSDILKEGKEHPHPTIPCKPNDINTIFFTSGTTGDPKGCIVTHASLMCSIKAFVFNTKETSFGKKKEIHLSFLPLTHVFERLIHGLMFLYTGKIAFFSGDVRYLTKEMKIIKPTVLFAVPRVLNKIHDNVLTEINKSMIEKIMFNAGLSSKIQEVKRGIIRKNSVWDYLIFRKIQGLLGGNVKILLVGSAPISSNVLDFFRAAMGSIIFEAYGQTETSGCINLTLSGDSSANHVGPPIHDCIIKFADVPELDLVVSRDNKGEICVKGPCCIKEYFENEENTKKLIDSEGWLHTGDVGQWTENGQLMIVDRCKHIFKLAQGEYLAPEKLENIYGLSSLVSQIFVTGNSLKEYCVAIVVPDMDGWKALGKDYKSAQDVCDDKDAKKILLKDLESTGRSNKLMGFEIVKKVYIWPKQFTIENGLLTPTFKLKRAEVSKYFEPEISKMYF